MHIHKNVTEESPTSKVRVALATTGHGGLEDKVSQVFGKSKTFTIIDVEEGEIKSVQVVENPVASYPHGAGPIAVKTLADMGVQVVLAAEVGPGVAALLDYHGMKWIIVKPGSKVDDVVREKLSEWLEAAE